MSTPLQQLKRSCQSIGCNLCCDLPAIKSLKKPLDELCEHHDGECCTIYGDRPIDCRDFSCQWLVDPLFPVELDPRSSKCYAEVTKHTRRDVRPDFLFGDEIAVQDYAQVNIWEESMGDWRSLMPWLEKVWTLYPTKGIQPAITVYSGLHWRSLVLLPNGDEWVGRVVARGKLNPMRPIHDAPLVTPEACQAMRWHLPSIKRAIRKADKARSK